MPTSLVRVERTLRDPRVRRATVFSGFARVLELQTMFTASCEGKEFVMFTSDLSPIELEASINHDVVQISG